MSHQSRMLPKTRARSPANILGGIVTMPEAQRAKVVLSGHWRMPSRVFVSVQTAAVGYATLVSLTETAMHPGTPDMRTGIATEHWPFPQTLQENIRAIDPSCSRHQPVTV